MCARPSRRPLGMRVLFNSSMWAHQLVQSRLRARLVVNGEILFLFLNGMHAFFYMFL